MVHGATIIAFLGLVGWAMVSDLRSFRIANWISLTIAGLFPLAAWSGGVDLQGMLLHHYAAGALILAVGVAAFVRGWTGGGDVKLLAAVAVWTGWSALAPLLLGMAFSGGAMALAVLALRSPLLRPLVTRSSLLARVATGDHLPYAVAIGLGVLMALPHMSVLAGPVLP